MAANTDEASQAFLTLTSCCAALFLTGHGLGTGDGGRVEDPCPKAYHTVELDLKLSYSVQAAVTKYQTGWLISSKFLTVLEAERVLAWSGCDEASLPGCRLSTSHCVLLW